MLRLSTTAALAFAVVGISWGWFADSQIILFDGVYALIGVGLAGLSLQAARMVEQGPTSNYPYGREALAPLIVGMQGLVLLGTFGYAVLEAVATILDGGSSTALGSALVYAVISLVGAVSVWALLRREAPHSELVAAEAAQWSAGWLLSLGMVVGFGVGLLLQGTSRAGLAAFIDPVLVILAALVILPTPVAMLRTMYRELLEASPPDSVSEPILAIIDDAGREYGLPQPAVRMGKLGRKVYIELDYLVAEGQWTVSDSDRIRRTLIERLQEPGRLLWLNVELHTDPDWDRD